MTPWEGTNQPLRSVVLNKAASRGKWRLIWRLHYSLSGRTTLGSVRDVLRRLGVAVGYRCSHIFQISSTGRLSIVKKLWGVVVAADIRLACMGLVVAG